MKIVASLVVGLTFALTACGSSTEATEKYEQRTRDDAFATEVAYDVDKLMVSRTTKKETIKLARLVCDAHEMGDSSLAIRDELAAGTGISAPKLDHFIQLSAKYYCPDELAQVEAELGK